MAVLAIMDIAFIVPATTVFVEAAGEWSKFESLFDLVGALFLSAWLLGWLTAPVLMTAILALMLFGREAIRVQGGHVEIFIGLPVAGLAAIYDISKMRNLRLEVPAKKSGSSWRGPHLVFDYGANAVRFGSRVGSEEPTELNSRFRMVSGKPVLKGQASPEDLETPWEPPVTKVADPLTDRSVSGSKPVAFGYRSAVMLVLANLVPVAGTLFFGWKLSDVMVLYWAESAIIGFFNACKIAVIGRWTALFAVPFFIGHFGGFMAVHFLFVYTIFVAGAHPEADSAGNLANAGNLFFSLWPAIAALFLSHAFSFFGNFLGRREYRERSVKTQMTEPYNRIIFMHLVLIFGGGLTLILGAPEPVLLIVIALKIYFDLKAHLRERVRFQRPSR